MAIGQSGSFVLGGTLDIYRLGFGAMRLTGKGIWGDPPERDAAKAVLRRAVDLGINFIDTADAYGPHTNETLIADALYPYPDGLIIATKGGLTRPGPDEWKPDGRPAHLREALEGSLRRLKVDCIDLYQFHRPDPDVPFAESIGALAELRREGKIQHLGLSNVSVEQLNEARKYVPVASVQNRFNLFDRSSRAVLEECELLDIGFIPWYPLATGQLTDGPLSEMAKQRGATPAQIALAWLLARSPVMLPIPGTSSLTHLEENVGAAAIGLSKDEVQTLTRLTTDA
jgi:pyridoxine 4-dehydrogenase